MRRSTSNRTAGRLFDNPSIRGLSLGALDPYVRRQVRGTRQTILFFSAAGDRKSTRLNSSHGYISYAVFCLKKKKKIKKKLGNTPSKKRITGTWQTYTTLTVSIPESTPTCSKHTTVTELTACTTTHATVELT